MKNFFIKAIVTLMTLASIATMGCVHAYAKTTTVTVDVDQIWTDLDSISRSGKYSYLVMRNIAVYPSSGVEDNFRYIQGNAKNSSGTQICNIVKLDEQSTKATEVPIYEGYLNTSSVIFRFRGNSPNYGAHAEVVYNAM